VVELDEERFLPLPAVQASLATESSPREILVALEGELSAAGTVELSCIELEPPAGEKPHRFRLAFDLRSEAGANPVSRPSAALRSGSSLPPSSTARPSQAGVLGSARPDPNRFDAALQAIERVFGKGRGDVRSREVKDLWRELERTLGERRRWSVETNRALFDRVIQLAAARRRSEDHERVFWMVSGYCLRPGFGYAADERRVAELSALFDTSVVFAQQARVWQQFWIAWRRVAAGLDEPTQMKIRDALDPFFAPAELKLKKPKGWKPLADEEMLELVSWLERVGVERRLELGRWLLERTWTRRDPRLWAALGRIGARVPAYASLHHVIPAHPIERWLEHLLRERWSEVTSAPRAAFQLARVTNDRARDVSEALRRQVAERLGATSAPEEWVQAVREFVPIREAERAEWFGEELPEGLRLVEGPDSDR
jgi:hypothetical protein